MISADGRKVKHQNESGVKVRGDAEKTDLYNKWARSSKLRIQRPGEMESGQVPIGMLRKGGNQQRVITFEGDGTTSISEKSAERLEEEGRARKPIVPFHGQVEEKYLTNKQKRIMERRSKTDRVLTGEGKSEIRSAAAIKKDAKAKEKHKLKQKPHLRKAKARESKDARMKMHEDRQMKFGARTKSKMLIFEGPKKWSGRGKKRAANGHGDSRIGQKRS